VAIKPPFIESKKSKKRDFMPKGTMKAPMGKTNDS
jgi:hypothetical protein